jgi:hypothetical protein
MVTGGIKTTVFLGLCLLATGAIAADSDAADQKGEKHKNLHTSEMNCRVGDVSYSSAGAMITFGNYLMYSSGSVLVVADISDPSVPLTVAEVGINGLAEEIVIKDDHAYCAYPQSSTTDRQN